MPKTMPTKYQSLLDDEDVKRWHDNLAARSIITAGVYLRGLGLYCAINHTTPREILSRAKENSFRDNFSDFVRRLEKKGKAGSYIARFKKVVLSWLAYNNISIELKVNIAGESDTPTISDERVPTREELTKIIRKASTRARVAIALIAFSGLRPESLGDYLGTDGIRLGDLRELKIKPDGTVEFEKIPSSVNVRRNLSKGRHQYFSFIPSEGATYIREYLEERVKAGEKLNDQSPLLQFDPRGARRNFFLRTTLVTRDIKEAILGAQFTWRPYVLRAYADTTFDIGESKGLISHPWRQFFMGHKGDIEAKYSTNKGRFPPDMVEQMREAYKRCEPLLSTEKEEASEEKIKQTFKEQLLLVAGFKKEEIEKMDLNSLAEEDLQQALRQKLLGMMANNGNRRRVVQPTEVKGMLGQGWEYVDQLSTGEAILRLPS